LQVNRALHKLAVQMLQRAYLAGANPISLQHRLVVSIKKQLLLLLLLLVLVVVFGATTAAGAQTPPSECSPWTAAFSLRVVNGASGLQDSRELRAMHTNVGQSDSVALLLLGALAR
jgi:hypothetical protein